MLKNILAVVFCIVGILLVTDKNSRELMFENADYYIFNLMQDGNLNTHILNFCEAKAFKAANKNIKFETAVYLNFVDVKILLKQKSASVCLIQTAGDTVNIYAFSNRIANKVHIGGRAVNVHISIAKNRVTVASPIIFASF